MIGGKITAPKTTGRKQLGFISIGIVALVCFAQMLLSPVKPDAVFRFSWFSETQGRGSTEAYSISPSRAMLDAA